MEAFVAVVGGLRSTREELGLARDVSGSGPVSSKRCPGPRQASSGLRQAFRQLSGCELVEGAVGAGGVRWRFASVQGPGVKALLDLEGLVDVERERVRLVSKAQKANAEAAKSRGQVGQPGLRGQGPA